jgi:hypothetical protein
MDYHCCAPRTLPQSSASHLLSTIKNSKALIPPFVGLQENRLFPRRPSISLKVHQLSSQIFSGERFLNGQQHLKITLFTEEKTKVNVLSSPPFQSCC